MALVKILQIAIGRICRLGNLNTVLRIQILMFLGLLDPDPDPVVRGLDSAPDPFIIKQNSKKNLIPYLDTVLWLLYDFLYLKNDVNVALKSNKPNSKKKKLIFRCHFEGHL
jgi:hypothetical protein